MRSNVDLSVVTPTYLEKENIKRMIPLIFKIFKKHNINGEIVVVDDNSPDGTSNIIKKLRKKYTKIKLIQRPTKLGIGSAYRDGISAAEGKIVITMDADFNHPPLKIPELYDLAKEGMIACGSRFSGKSEFSTDIFHRLATIILNIWIRLLHKIEIKDVTLGFLAISRNNLKIITKKLAKYKLQPFENTLYSIDLLVCAHKIKIPLREVKVNYKKRKYGSSKINFFQGLKIVLSSMIHSVVLLKMK